MSADIDQETLKDRKVLRRREYAVLIDYLQSGLYTRERAREYGDEPRETGLTKPILPVKPKLDPDKDMCFASPLGWRCVLSVDIDDPEQKITISIHDIDGMIVAGGKMTYGYTDFNYNVGINFLERTLP